MYFDHVPSLFDKKNEGFRISLESKEILTKWLKNPSPSAIFYGEPGRGKSYAAIRFAKTIGQNLQIDESKNNFYRENAYCFCVLSELNQYWLSNLNESHSMMKRLSKVGCLVMDDLGVRMPSDGFLDFFYAIVNERQLNQLPTIYTTNLSSKEMNTLYGSRIVSRLYSGIRIEFIGEDRRFENC